MIARRTLLAVTASLVVLAGALGLAHDDHRVTGTLTEVQLTGIVVKPERGQPVAIGLNAATKVVRDGKKASVLDLKPGLSVVVAAHGDAMDDLMAETVTIVSPPAKK